jgi:hypothetical protein
MGIVIASVGMSASVIVPLFAGLIAGRKGDK